MDARQEARRAKPESIILGSVVRKQKKSAALKFLAQRLVKRGVPADERPLLMAALERELDAKIYYGDRSNLDARATASVHSKGEDAPVMTREQADEFSLNSHKKSLNGSKLLILGVAYKKDVDDLRESPSLKIMQLLQQRGAQIDYNDPYFPRMHKMRHFNFENMKSVSISKESLAQYDAAIIATDHSSYDYHAIVDGSKLVVDTRNATRRVTRNRERIVPC